MQSPFDASELKTLRENIFQDDADGYFIADIAKIRAEFDGRIQALNTREMKLDTLGVFPLPKASLPLLKKSIEFEGKKLAINPLFLKSQIPIFSDSDGKFAYIPAEGAHICRYFFELWKIAENEADETETVIAGFTILASYAGL